MACGVIIGFATFAMRLCDLTVVNHLPTVQRTFILKHKRKHVNRQTTFVFFLTLIFNNQLIRYLTENT